MTTKEQFIEMAKGITRPGIDQMMAWLETTDFYTAPASTRFHGAEEGGLCAHSITVAKRLLEIADLWAPNQYSRDALLTVALFHDLCKISTYTVSTRNVKDDTTGQWTKVPFYKFEPKDSVGCDSHGSLSCYRIMATGMQLSMEEFAAVNKAVCEGSVCEDAVVRGEVSIKSKAICMGHSLICDSAIVNGIVRGYATVAEKANVKEGTIVEGDTYYIQS